MDDFDRDDLAADYWDSHDEPFRYDGEPAEYNAEPADIDGGELSFDPYAGTAIFWEDDNDDYYYEPDY